MIFSFDAKTNSVHRNIFYYRNSLFIFPIKYEILMLLFFCSIWLTVRILLRSFMFGRLFVLDKMRSVLIKIHFNGWIFVAYKQIRRHNLISLTSEAFFVLAYPSSTNASNFALNLKIIKLRSILCPLVSLTHLRTITSRRDKGFIDTAFVAVLHTIFFDAISHTVNRNVGRG